MVDATAGWLATPECRVLPNGLTIACLKDDAAPLVSSALWYRAGTAHEPAAANGLAHFLEHMMFKGSARFAPGEIDRQTLAVGGSNNAYTSHDGTVYVFNVPREHWRLPLEIEADRMLGLQCEPREVDAERAVVEEEIREVDDDPWDALSMRVLETFYGDHPYGRRILGSTSSLRRIGAAELVGFHMDRYAPSNAVLTVAGAIDDEALEWATGAFGEIPARGTAANLPEPSPPRALSRVRVRLGRTQRGLLAMASPPATSDEFSYLRIALTALVGGRSSALQRRLVDTGRLCQSVSSEITETVLPGVASLAVELLPGAERQAVEEELFAELDRCRQELEPAAVERARRLLIADWLFGHETIEARGATVGAGLALFGTDYAQRQFRAIREATIEQVREAAARWLDPHDGGVLGWAVR